MIVLKTGVEVEGPNEKGFGAEPQPTNGFISFVTHGCVGSTHGQNRRSRDTHCWELNPLTTVPTLFLLFSRIVSKGSSQKARDPTGYYRTQELPIARLILVHATPATIVSLKMGHKISFTLQLFCYTARITGTQVEQGLLKRNCTT